MNLRELDEDTLREHEATAVLQSLIRAGHPLMVAYSGGKDSTVALALTLNAAASERRAGGSVPPIVVTHGDTGIENPTVSALARHELKKVQAFARQHDIEVHTAIATPALNDTWAVSVLSGRKLPTFANAATRDCTVAYKIAPMVKLRKQTLKRLAHQGAAPITVIGTRFEESTGRAERMEQRNESAIAPWEKDGALFISPIALWTSDDVWTSIARLGAGDMPGFTNGKDVFELYAAGGGTSCAVVSDMATEGAKKSRACGARFGCSLCAAVGRDKSLENMLESDPKYAWLKGLNAIQRFLVDTQYDFDRRNWLGRTIDAEGFVTVTPDTYSPTMLAELLRYCLTVDADERDAARRAGVLPRFELVSPQALIAIDAFWSVHALQDNPYAAVAIWLDVQAGARYYPPANVVAYPARGFPTRKYIFVGKNWDGGHPSPVSGLRDVLKEMAMPDADVTVELKDGRQVLRTDEEELFDIDAGGAIEFLSWGAEEKVAEAKARPMASARAFHYYATLGVLATSKRHLGLLDTIARRSTWKREHGLAGAVRPAVIKAMAMSKDERDAYLDKAIDSAGLGTRREPLSLRERLCRPMYL